MWRLWGGYNSVLAAALVLEFVQAGDLECTNPPSNHLKWESTRRVCYQAFIHGLLILSCGVMAYLYKTIVNNKRVHHQVVEDRKRLEQEYRRVACGLQDEISDLKCVHAQKRKLEEELKLSRGEVLVLQAHLEKSESDRSEMADMVKGYSEDAAKMKSQLSDAQAWQKECVRMDDELNDLHKVSEDKGKTIKAMEKKLAAAEGWEEERGRLMACVDESDSDLQKVTEELEALRKAAEDAEYWKARSHAHSRDKSKLVECAQGQKKMWEKYRAKAKLWRERAKGFQQEGEHLKAALENSKKECDKMGEFVLEASEKEMELSKKLKAKSDELESVEATLKSTKAAFGHVKETLDITISDKIKTQGAMEKLKESIQQLQRTLNASQDCAKELEVIVAEKTAQVNKGEERLNNMWRTAEKHRGETIEVEKALERSQGECAELGKELRRRVDEAHHLKGALMEANEKVRSLEEALEQASLKKNDSVERWEQETQTSDAPPTQQYHGFDSSAQDRCDPQAGGSN